MRKVLYAMHFRGRISPAATDSRLLRTTGSATSCVVSTIIGSGGVECDVKPSEGELAFMESALRITGPTSFQEDGTITFGDANEHVLRFSTVGEGTFTPGLEPQTMNGTASWEVAGGEGQFSAAKGFITSAFTVSNSGEIDDFHCGLIFLAN